VERIWRCILDESIEDGDANWKAEITYRATDDVFVSISVRDDVAIRDGET